MKQLKKISGAVLVLLCLAAPAAAQHGAAKYAASPSAFDLAPVPVTWTKLSEMQCSIYNVGRICDSHIAGFWPAGTPNAHMYEFGPQLTAVLPRAPGCTDAMRATSRAPDCFPWAGDTTGAFFSEVSGLRVHRATVEGLYDSRPLNDAEDWPAAPTTPAYPFLNPLIADTSVFHPSLIGRRYIAVHDTWGAYGDGMGLNSRSSPLGIVVEQRTLTWSYPEGNEATIYIVYRVTNVTHTAAFQAAAEAAMFGGADRLPDEGWRLDSIYFSLYADPDVGRNYSLNHLTGSLPFDMLIGYQGPFTDPAFAYPAQYFHPPFFGAATSLVGLHFLRGAGAGGMTAINSYTSGGAFPVPTTMQRAWRIASNNTNPLVGDPNCALPGTSARESGYCFMLQSNADVRGTIATGPFSLAPGSSETIIVALTAAATVETPRITPGSTAGNAPGFPAPRPGCAAEPIRPIEEGAGWVETLTCPGTGRVDPMDVSTVPGSLFNRAQIARAIAGNRFVMPAAPAPPAFDLVAARDSIIVRWQPSVTETEGDPYFAIASDSDSPLYDPAYRRNDVEGYRIWRGVRTDSMRMIAQFDHTGTTFIDNLCRTDPQHLTGDPCDAPAALPLNRPLVQHFTARLASGGVTALRTDTAMAAAVATGNAAPLSDTGVPFVFVDTDVQPGVTYHYSVTAFDINSMRSAPTSLESERAIRSARASLAGNPLRAIHTVPDPYYGRSTFDASGVHRQLRFVNMPPRATIRIYTVSGVLVDVIDHHDASGLGHAEWDLRGRGNHRVRSGVYFFHVSTPAGHERIGRFTVVMPNGG